MMTRRNAALLCFGLMVAASYARGQMQAHARAKAQPSAMLTATGPEGRTLTLSPADLKAMTHKSVTVVNGHTSASETYTGVPLTELLAKVGVPVGKDLKGKAYLMYLVAEGTDHYRVLYSLDEVDSAAHAGEVIVVGTLNGAPLGESGAFELVSSEDKRPARWVRNLLTLTVKVAE